MSSKKEKVKETIKETVKETEHPVDVGNSRQIPEGMKKSKALAYNQNHMAIERTELSKIRTELAFTNTQLSINRTHLSYLRTIVSLIGTGATVYKALPLIGVSQTFTSILTAFLFISALYFIYKDATTYPKMKKQLQEMKAQSEALTVEKENLVYFIEED